MKLSHILTFLLALCVFGLPIEVILTHADGVRFTWFPDPPPGVTRSLSQEKDTMAVVREPPMCKQAKSLGPPGVLERSVVTVSSPHNCPWEVRPLLFSLWFCVIFAGLKAHARGEHTTLVLAGSVFLVPLRCWENRRAGLKDTGQLCSLWRRESTGRRPQQQPHLLPIDLLPDPCALEPIHQMKLPPYSTWMCWKIGIITRWPTWGVSSSPRKVNLAGDRLSPTAALTPGGPWNPTQRRARLPREAHLSSRPQTSEHGHSDAGTELSSRSGLYPGLHVLVHTEHGQV